MTALAPLSLSCSIRRVSLEHIYTTVQYFLVILPLTAATHIQPYYNKDKSCQWRHTNISHKNIKNTWKTLAGSIVEITSNTKKKYSHFCFFFFIHIPTSLCITKSFSVWEVACAPIMGTLWAVSVTCNITSKRLHLYVRKLWCSTPTSVSSGAVHQRS